MAKSRHFVLPTLVLQLACAAPDAARHDAGSSHEVSSPQSGRVGKAQSVEELIEFPQVTSAGSSLHASDVEGQGVYLLTEPCAVEGTQPAYLDKNARLIFLRSGGSCMLQEVVYHGSIENLKVVWMVDRTTEPTSFFPDRYHVQGLALDLIVLPNCGIGTTAKVLISSYPDSEPKQRALEAIVGHPVATGDLSPMFRLSMVDFDTSVQCEVLGIAVPASKFISEGGSVRFQG